MTLTLHYYEKASYNRVRTFSDIPVDEGAFGIHEVKLVVKSGPGLGDGCGVTQHTHGPLDIG